MPEIARWTGSTGEGLMVAFAAIDAATVGTDLARLLEARSDETISGSAARVDLGTEELFTVKGLPRAAYRPQLYLSTAERDGPEDPVLARVYRRNGVAMISARPH